MAYSRSPQVLLDTCAHEIHRTAVLEKLWEHDYPATSWDPDFVGDALQTLYDNAIANEEAPIPMWDSVELDGGWKSSTKIVEKPVYPVTILGSTGISLAQLNNLAYANVPSHHIELESYVDVVDTPIRAIDIVLHTGIQTGRQSFNVHNALKNNSAFVFLIHDMPPLAMHRKTLFRATNDFELKPFKTRTIDMAQSQAPEGTSEFLSEDTCASLILALECSTKELRMAAE